MEVLSFFSCKGQLYCILYVYTHITLHYLILCILHKKFVQLGVVIQVIIFLILLSSTL